MAQKVPERYEVYAPGWEDVIHIFPDAALAPRELRERKRRRAERIRKSPTPDVVRSAQEIMTWVDDVQDGLVTLSLATRVVTKYTGKIIPGARWIATGADALNVAGALEALGTGFPQDKRRMRDLIRRQPGSYRARLLRTARSRRVDVGLGELLQVAQTSDTLFGIGISLGAVMSAPIDSLFLTTTGGDLVFPNLTPDVQWDALERYYDATGGTGPLTEEEFDRLMRLPAPQRPDLRIPIPRLIPTLAEIGDLFGFEPDPVPTGELLDAAQTSLEAAALLQHEGQALAFEDHIAVTAAQHLGLQVLGTIHALRDWTNDALLKMRAPLPRHLTMDPSTSLALQRVGMDPQNPGQLPLPGAPSDATWGNVLQTIPRAASAALPHWLNEAPDPGAALFGAHLTWDVARRYLWALEGPDTAIEETLTPEALAVELLLNAELPPAIWRNPKALQAAHRSVTDTLRILDARRLDPGTLLAAATAALAAHPLP